MFAKETLSPTEVLTKPVGFTDNLEPFVQFIDPSREVGVIDDFSELEKPLFNQFSLGSFALRLSKAKDNMVKKITPDTLSSPRSYLIKALIGAAGIGGCSTLAVPASGADYKAPSVAPDAYTIITNAQQQIIPEAGEKKELAVVKDAIRDLQSSYERDEVTGVTVRQRRGSKKMRVTLKQNDFMAVTGVGNTYIEKDYPEAPGVPEQGPTKEFTKFFYTLMSTDIVNKFTVKMRAGSMTPRGKCINLGKSVIVPSFEKYDVSMLPPQVPPRPLIKIGDKIGAYRAVTTTEALVAPRVSTVNLKTRTPFSAKSRGSCVVTYQDWQPRKLAYGNNRGTKQAIYGPFKKSKSSRKDPKHFTIKHRSH